MKIAVIADSGHVPQFARDALDRVAGVEDVTVFSCTNTAALRRPFRHGAYYALNLLTVRNPLTRGVPVEGGTKRVRETVEFASGWDAAWQVLPPQIVRQMRAFDVILKFGMGLLRVPPPETLPPPILSYHHGDPDRYRGRPAGFWEIMDGAPVIGQIVQAIGDRVDAGRVLAFAETKVFPWSYRATLIESYRHSPLIINAAIANAIAGRFLPKGSRGRNRRLPSNAQVLAFVARMGTQLARRLAYGAFVEKRWRVSEAVVAPAAVPSLLEGRLFPPCREWRTLPVPKPYASYADPFFSGDPPEMLVEGLKGWSGTGDIVLVSGETHRVVSQRGRHMSYPATITLQGRRMIVPEISAWSSQKIFILEEDGLKEVAGLEIEQDPRILDPTLFARDDRIYLFGNTCALGSNALCLWSADRLDGLFTAHPKSPVRISPEGSRMAGNLIDRQGRLVRLGQDSRFRYGDGIVAFEIETLTPDDYRERRIGRLCFGDRRGPHTLNLRGDRIAFDWYSDRFMPLAALRRMMARRHDRNAAR